MSAYQRLVNEIDSLVLNEGIHTREGHRLDFVKLDECDQQKIVAGFIDYDDRDLFSIYENEKSDDITASLLTMLKNDSLDSDEDFAKCLKKNLTAYYAKRAQDLIDERCAELESNERWEHGQTRRQDRNTGETYWASI